MKRWAMAVAASLAVPSAAFACSCVFTEDPVELRNLAKEVVPDAIAMVEAETVLTFEESKGAGDRMRVVRVLAGSATGEFRVERRHFPSGASCDQLYEKGKRGIMILYPASKTAGGEAIYKVSGLCAAGLLEQRVYRDEVVRLMGSRPTAERG